MACQKLQKSKLDACWILVITLHRTFTSAVYVRHHHQIEHDGAKSPSQAMRCLKRTWLWHDICHHLCVCTSSKYYSGSDK